MSVRHAIAAQEWFSAAELAAAGLPGLPSSKRGVTLLADREGWAQRQDDDGRPMARKRSGQGGGVEYHLALLPEAAQARLMGPVCPGVVERPDRESSWMRWERLPASMKAVAQHRLEIIQEVEGFMRRGLGKESALATVTSHAARVARAQGEQPPFSGSSLRNWFARIAGVDTADRLVYLAPDYAGRTSKVDLTPEAFDSFAGDYLRNSLPSYESCYRRLIRCATEKGWTVPSAKTLQRRLDAQIPPMVQLYLRKGENALAHAFPHLERSRAGIGALQIINLDGHTWDNRVEWPDGTISRPLSVAVQDIASGKVLALRFDETLNQHLVRLALADVFRDHGIPEVALMDNGRENAAASISGGQPTRWRWKVREEEPAGVLKMLGINAIWAKPYWGQSKPIERMFRDWAGDIAKHPAFEGSYTGPNTSSKPANYGSRAIPIAEFEARVREELVHYNAQLGRTGSHMGGRSFDQVYAALVERKPPRQATAEQLRLCLMQSQPVSMDPRTRAVRIADHRFCSPALQAVKPQRVVVRFDPENLRAAVHVYTIDGRFLAEAGNIGLGSFDNAADGQKHGRALAQFKRATKAQARALVKVTAAEVAMNLPIANPPETPPEAPSKVVRPAFGAPRTAETAGGSTDFNDDWGRGITALVGGG
jgi:putative transposase